MILQRHVYQMQSIDDLNLESRIENKVDNLHGFRIGKGFLTCKKYSLEGKTLNNFSYIKIKNYFLSKDTEKIIKGKPQTERGAMHITDQRIVSREYKEVLQIIQTNNSGTVSKGSEQTVLNPKTKWLVTSDQDGGDVPLSATKLKTDFSALGSLF